MSDSPEIVNATVELIRLYRHLFSEILRRERQESFTRIAKHKRDLAVEECEALKKQLEETRQRLADVKTANENSVRSLTEGVAKLEAERAKLVTQNMLLRDRMPKMKEGPNGCPVLCLRCGKAKGKRAYTCPKCFNTTHRDGVDESRNEWRLLREAWAAGERDFPRP